MTNKPARKALDDLFGAPERDLFGSAKPAPGAFVANPMGDKRLPLDVGCYVAAQPGHCIVYSLDNNYVKFVEMSAYGLHSTSLPVAEFIKRWPVKLKYSIKDAAGIYKDCWPSENQATFDLLKKIAKG